MTVEEIFARVRRLVAEETGVAEEDITFETVLFDIAG